MNNSPKKIAIYGPFADEYSLAKVNRYFAQALSEIAGDGYKVVLTAKEEEVGKLPSADTYQKYPYLKDLYEPYTEDANYDILIYNNFPKDPNAQHGLAKLSAKRKVVFIAWEEDKFPKRWVDEFNQNLVAVFASTNHTKTVLKRSGVTLPIIVVPNAMAPEIEKLSGQGMSKDSKDFYDLQLQDKYVFLHVSSGFDRKSPELLLAGYKQASKREDNTVLVIKSFPSGSNKFPDLIERYQQDANAPEIRFIDDAELTDAQMFSLWQQADCYLSPSKAEGFNLPVLEAMAAGCPVITTAWSGQMDFCADEYTYLVDYELVPARSHLDNPGAFWAEPDITSFKEKLQQAFQEKGSDKQNQMIALAKQRASVLTWTNVASLAKEIISEILAIDYEHLPELEIISTYNSVCGIAEYSSYLYPPIMSSLPSVEIIANKDAIGRKKVDPKNVIRKWKYADLDFSELFAHLDEKFAEKKDNSKNKVVAHIQYNLGFYTFSSLETLINGLNQRNFNVVLTPHAVQHQGSEMGQMNHDVLKAVKQIHVLNQQDLEYFQSLGLQNVYHFAHGNIEFSKLSKSIVRKRLGLDKYEHIVATHGFMVEKKGLMEVLESIALLKEKYPNLLYLAVNAVNPNNMSSQAEKENFTGRITELGLSDNVIHVDSFLEKEEIMLLLSAADLSVFAYPENKEAASGSVRLGIAAGRPVITTESTQLKDLNKYCYAISTNQPEEIAKAITALLDDKEVYVNQVIKQEKLLSEINWDKLGLTCLKLYGSLA
jgi:glycosyltransferase involved in cell wall biosynthesis